MSRFLRSRAVAVAFVSALTALGVAVPAASAAPAPAQSLVTVHIIGIDRAGKRVAVQSPVVAGPQGGPVLTGESHGRIAAGTYLFSGVVPTPGASPAAPLLTLVVRLVRVSHSQTISLDARGGHRLKFALNVPGAQDVMDGAEVWTEQASTFLAGTFDDPAGTTYVASSAVTGLCLGYLSRWQDPSGQFYDLAGTVHGRIPAHPSFAFRASTLARVTLSVRSGTMAAPEDVIFSAPGCNTQDIEPAQPPSAQTGFFSPGQWGAELFGVQSSDSISASFRSGHRYSLSLAAAVVGPGGSFAAGSYPVINGSVLSYSPDGLFDYPQSVVFSGNCCARSVIRLTLDGHLVKKETLPPTETSSFAARLRSAAWYQLSITASQLAVGPGEPPAVLSPRVNLTWRFNSSLGGGVVPVTVTSLVPAGLSLANDAPAGGTTRVRITISLAYDPGDAGMVRYPIRSVRLEVSADGGRTWQVVRVTGHGLTRWAQVPDPASGYVTIRTVVTDVRGDTSTQTVYQAYGVAASAG